MGGARLRGLRAHQEQEARSAQLQETPLLEASRTPGSRRATRPGGGPGRRKCWDFPVAVSVWVVSGGLFRYAGVQWGVGLGARFSRSWRKAAVASPITGQTRRPGAASPPRGRRSLPVLVAALGLLRALYELESFVVQAGSVNLGPPGCLTTPSARRLQGLGGCTQGQAEFVVAGIQKMSLHQSLIQQAFI